MTADERINDLLARAGSPVMIVKNTQESDEEKHDGEDAAIDYMAESKFHGDAVGYIRHLVDTIDRMEAALHNVLNERDHLKERIDNWNPAWISVEERLPEDGETVLTCKNGIVEVQSYEKNRNGWIKDNWFWSMATVSHWMPMPEPPKEEHGTHNREDV